MGPSAIGFGDLSPELQTELVDLQKRMTAELKPLLLEQTLSMQKILEAADHEGRVALMQYFVDAERKRLQAKKTLKGMICGSRGEGGADAVLRGCGEEAVAGEEDTERNVRRGCVGGDEHGERWEWWDGDDGGFSVDAVEGRGGCQQITVLRGRRG